MQSSCPWEPPLSIYHHLKPQAMKRLLLADDHHFVRLGLMHILKDEYPVADVKETSDSESLIEQVLNSDWDLLILDLEMPGVHGLQALEQVKLIKPPLPVLVLSYFTEDLYGLRVLKAGASGYMNKNAAPYELIAAVERIFSGKKYITPGLAEKLLLHPQQTGSSHRSLSHRELQVFMLLSTGKTISQIAAALSLALTTVSTHRCNILEKLGLSSNSELTRYAVTHQIIEV